MIETAKKPFQEVLAALHGFERIGIVGCDGCAKVCFTGGTEEVADMAKQLTKRGKKIIFAVAPERPCKLALTRPVLAPFQARMQACDALLVLGCGAGLQIIYHVTETLGLALPFKSGLKTLGPMEAASPGEVSPEQHQEDGAGLVNACLRQP